MARVGADRAGKGIERSAQKFIRDTVRIEEDAYEGFLAALERGVPTARKVVRSAWKDDPPRLSDVATVSRLTDLHTTALMRALDVWEESLWAVMVAAIRSAQRELRWLCRYAEPGDLPVVDRVANQMLVEALPLFTAGTSRARAGVAFTAETFRERVVRQALLAREAGDDADVVEARVLSPEKVTAAGISGRGVWWRSIDSLASGLTLVGVQSGNLLKAQSIELFNARARE